MKILTNSLIYRQGVDFNRVLQKVAVSNSYILTPKRSFLFIHKIYPILSQKLELTRFKMIPRDEVQELEFSPRIKKDDRENILPFLKVLINFGGAPHLQNAAELIKVELLKHYPEVHVHFNKFSDNSNHLSLVLDKNHQTIEKWEEIVAPDLFKPKSDILLKKLINKMNGLYLDLDKIRDIEKKAHKTLGGYEIHAYDPDI